MKVGFQQHTPYYNSYSQSFCGKSEYIINSRGFTKILDKESNKILNSNNTAMFRKGRNWNALVDTLFENNIENLHILGCSNGSEPMSLGILLIERLGIDKVKQKFGKIYACDKDPEILKDARSGFVYINADDIERINNMTQGKFSKYFSKDPRKVYGADNSGHYKVCKDLTDIIKYEQKDALDFCKEKLPPNTYVSLSNFIPFIDDVKKHRFLFENLYSNTGNNTLITLGAFDTTYTNSHIMLKSLGFKQLEKEITSREFIEYDPSGQKIYPGAYTFNIHSQNAAYSKGLKNSRILINH